MVADDVEAGKRHRAGLHRMQRRARPGLFDVCQTRCKLSFIQTTLLRHWRWRWIVLWLTLRLTLIYFKGFRHSWQGLGIIHTSRKNIDQTLTSRSIIIRIIMFINFPLISLIIIIFIIHTLKCVSHFLAALVAFLLHVPFSKFTQDYHLSIDWCSCHQGWTSRISKLFVEKKQESENAPRIRLTDAEELKLKVFQNINLINPNSKPYIFDILQSKS